MWKEEEQRKIINKRNRAKLKKRKNYKGRVAMKYEKENVNREKREIQTRTWFQSGQRWKEGCLMVVMERERLRRLMLCLGMCSCTHNTTHTAPIRLWLLWFISRKATSGKHGTQDMGKKKTKEEEIKLDQNVTSNVPMSSDLTWLGKHDEQTQLESYFHTIIETHRA